MHEVKLVLAGLQGSFDGKKTYIVGGLMVVLGLLQGDTEMVGTGLGLIFLRNGIAKV